jgi:CelD/BcsL family acetyltransferase involved in cellulose biosynthesis
MESPQIFYTYEWALAVSRAYRNSVTPLVFLGYEEDLLVGVAALGESIQRPGQRSFLAGATADYCDFVCSPTNAPLFCRAVLDNVSASSFSDITFPNMPKDSPSVAAIRTHARKIGYHVSCRTAYHCAQIVLGKGGDREQLRAGMEKRQSVKRQIASMSKMAPVTVSHDRNGTQIADSLPEFFRMHVARFMVMGRTSNLVSHERRAFLRELTHQLSETGWLVNSRLTVGDQTAASNFGFRFAGTWFWYQPILQHRMVKTSPGLCLLSKIITAACDAPDVSVVDLGLGAEEYKERFANASRETLHMTVHASAASYLKETVRHRSAKLAAKSPAAESFLRRQRERVAKEKKRGLLVAGERVLNAIRRRAFSTDEVLFYRWQSFAPSEQEAFQLKSIEMEDLAEASMRYCDDAETQAYLLRSARRLHGGQAQGYMLVTPDEIAVHFCWTSRFNGFHMDELDHVLHSMAPDCELMFDCWTPGSQRGKKYYPRAISMLADHLAASGSVPWIFSGKENKPSQSGILSAGFEPQFSLIRRRSLFITRLLHTTAASTSSGLEPAAFAA